MIDSSAAVREDAHMQHQYDETLLQAAARVNIGERVNDEAGNAVKVTPRIKHAALKHEREQTRQQAYDNSKRTIKPPTL